MSGWIGVDLDGTLALYDGWKGPEHIGDPIPKMADRVKAWLAEGRTIKIFTARVSAPAVAPFNDCAALARQSQAAIARAVIQAWTEKHFGVKLEVTCQKDFDMIELWDDRCVQVQPNTGELVADFWRHSL